MLTLLWRGNFGTLLFFIDWRILVRMRVLEIEYSISPITIVVPVKEFHTYQQEIKTDAQIKRFGFSNDKYNFIVLAKVQTTDKDVICTECELIKKHVLQSHGVLNVEDLFNLEMVAKFDLFTKYNERIITTPYKDLQIQATQFQAVFLRSDEMRHLLEKSLFRMYGSN